MPIFLIIIFNGFWPTFAQVEIFFEKIYLHTISKKVTFKSYSSNIRIKLRTNPSRIILQTVTQHPHTTFLDTSTWDLPSRRWHVTEKLQQYRESFPGAYFFSFFRKQKHRNIGSHQPSTRNLLLDNVPLSRSSLTHVFDPRKKNRWVIYIKRYNVAAFFRRSIPGSDNSKVQLTYLTIAHTWMHFHPTSSHSVYMCTT